jgi:hypothetical protein
MVVVFNATPTRTTYCPLVDGAVAVSLPAADALR